MRVTSARALAAAQTLGLEGAYTPEDVTAAFRTLSKTCHPNGGTYDPERWFAIEGAKDALLAYLQANPPPKPPSDDACRACAGSGRVKRGNLQMMCVMCNGSGEPR